MKSSDNRPPTTTTNNHAGDNARVGFQGVVHGDLKLVVPPDASPAEKFQAAKAHLDSRSITTARKLMEEVVHAGHTSAEIWFYWLLAYLSRRTLRELSPTERDRLEKARETAAGVPGADRWTRGIRVIGQVLDAAESGAGQSTSITECLIGLDDKPQDEIHRHLGLLLRDAVRNDVWRQDIASAIRRQRAANREKRVWKFFEPDPRAARVYPLADRPSDAQMAEWLDCDVQVLLDQTMSRYQLRRDEIQTYASLEAPGPNCRNARIPNGPWRYSTYRIVVFLLTREGVRQIEVDLRFAQGTFHSWNRMNYRFEAVAAVRVEEGDDGARDFDLSLISGENVEVRATDSTQADPAVEDPRIVADASMDAAGLRSTLFMLEGVAAEGRAWWHARHPRSSDPDDDPVRRMGGKRETAEPRR
ncbi:hypothetical protein ACWT_5558 [Actinoplanes sp. SE50]|uniref:hypothetical protein n=1 Tax=unclassified Actinoplanes TaxID=2626549 RepID=UPI00023ECD40|nr:MULTISPECIES: hypothetical protein [unclassified Actinoplanes]AEV86575.1 hypothetical protein ACPL_5688 [Actinoplanes sp. SE50/110]ATO84973.1 hypothetical protein ACWT_5558 [Actinoplanes sp. SE50]SLM02382.1 hypothetical protein ACSP50_5631 [Actinoplanes sp. SE50/110]